jgi:hypothetical protein
MSSPYEVKIIRLPLPLGPLGKGHPEPKRRPISPRAKFSTEAEALRYAVMLQDEGYGAAVIDPDGNEWINIRERAIQLFRAERASLIGELQRFESARLAPDKERVTTIRNNVAELDRYLGAL